MKNKFCEIESTVSFDKLLSLSIASVFNYPYKLKKESHTEEIKKDEIKSVKEEIKDRIKDLMKMGKWEEALEELEEKREIFDVGDFKKIRREIENWINLWKKAEEKELQGDRETAVSLLKELALMVPFGPSKEKVLLKINNIEKDWYKEIDALKIKFNSEKDLNRKLEIVKRLIEIVPIYEKQEWEEREKYILAEIEEKKRRPIYAIIIAVSILMLIILILKLISFMSLQRKIEFAKSMLNSSPEKALEILHDIQKKKDDERIRQLILRAKYLIKNKTAMKKLEHAELLLKKLKPADALVMLQKAREAYRGDPPSLEFEKKENKIRKLGLEILLSKAREKRKEKDFLEAYEYYKKALEFKFSTLVKKEFYNFKEENKKTLLYLFKNEALRKLERGDCKGAMHAIEEALKLKVEPEALMLRERINKKCLGGVQ